MLRSLVGSEMCIRDSARRKAYPERGLPRRSTEESADPFHETSARRRNDCLLYTSDAADDLLCVDLGGRRIIKKKK